MFFDVALQTIAVYAFLIVTIRTIGRRTLTQLSSFDLLVILLLGSAVETAMVNGSSSFWLGLTAATVLLVTNRLLTTAMLRSKRFRHLVNGGPVVLVHDGKFVEERLRRVGLTHGDVRQALREREIADLDDVRFAVLEPDGRINVVTRSARVLRTGAPA